MSDFLNFYLTHVIVAYVFGILSGIILGYVASELVMYSNKYKIKREIKIENIRCANTYRYGNLK